MLPLLLLAACGTGAVRTAGVRGLSCAPFARELTGLDLHGPAASWWEAADGRYARVHAPEVGSVLVFARQSRLPSGHVSVVSRVRGPRTIEVIQANWAAGLMERDQPVVDVSDRGDWSLVRVWWSPIGAMGAHPYVVDGFIVPKAPLGHDALAAGAGAAASRAAGG